MGKIADAQWREIQQMYGPYEIHPAAKAFPFMTDKEFEDLVTNLRLDGCMLQYRIVVARLPDDPKLYLADGRNRWFALKRLGITPTEEEHIEIRDFESHDDVWAFVYAANLDRRHLTPTRVAGICLERAAHFKADAKARQRAGGRKGGLTSAGSGKERKKPLRAFEEMAAQTGNKTSARTIAARHKVEQEGVPELYAAMCADRVTAYKAERALRLTPDQQREVARTGELPVMLPGSKELTPEIEPPKPTRTPKRKKRKTRVDKAISVVPLDVQRELKRKRGVAAEDVDQLPQRVWDLARSVVDGHGGRKDMIRAAAAALRWINSTKEPTE